MEDRAASTAGAAVELGKRKAHESAILQLSEEFAVEHAAMKEVYEELLDELKARARIKEYLSIFVVRAIRDLFRPAVAGAPRRLDPALAEKYRNLLLPRDG
ncbi:MAG: hypothetical protein AB1568_04950 [Thermodesulfobacteriota bacterium]